VKHIHLLAVLPVALIVAASSSAAAQAHWVPLGDVGGHNTAIDTTSIRQSTPERAVVQLRLYESIGRGIDEIQTLEVDCRAERSRLRATRELATERSPIAAGPQGSRTVSDTTWKQNAAGSLGSEQVRAVCRFLSSRAAH
jgi:hypothetical protein